LIARSRSSRLRGEPLGDGEAANRRKDGFEDREYPREAAAGGEGEPPDYVHDERDGQGSSARINSAATPTTTAASASNAPRLEPPTAPARERERAHAEESHGDVRDDDG